MMVNHDDHDGLPPNDCDESLDSLSSGAMSSTGLFIIFFLFKIYGVFDRQYHCSQNLIAMEK